MVNRQRSAASIGSVAGAMAAGLLVVGMSRIPTSGALGPARSEVGTHECMAIPPSHRVTLGGDVIRDGSDEDVVIDSIALDHPVGLHVIGTALMAPDHDARSGGDTLVGYVDNYPPHTLMETASGRRQWDGRLRLPAVVHPRDTWGLVLGVALDTDDNPHSGPAVVHCHQGPVGRTAEMGIDIDLRPHSC